MQLGLEANVQHDGLHIGTDGLAGQNHLTAKLQLLGLYVECSQKVCDGCTWNKPIRNTAIATLFHN